MKENPDVESPTVRSSQCWSRRNLAKKSTRGYFPTASLGVSKGTVGAGALCGIYDASVVGRDQISGHEGLDVFLISRRSVSE